VCSPLCCCSRVSAGLQVGFSGIFLCLSQLVSRGFIGVLRAGAELGPLPVPFVVFSSLPGCMLHTAICYRWFTKLTTTICFNLVIGHLQVVLFLVLRLTIQYTMFLLLLMRSHSHLTHPQITLNTVLLIEGVML